MFVLAMLLDVVYQLIVLGWVYPFEVILVAFILAILPYLTLRGLVNRVASKGKAQPTLSENPDQIVP